MGKGKVACQLGDSQHLKPSTYIVLYCIVFWKWQMARSGQAGAEKL